MVCSLVYSVEDRTKGDSTRFPLRSRFRHWTRDLVIPWSSQDRGKLGYLRKVSCPSPPSFTVPVICKVPEDKVSNVHLFLSSTLNSSRSISTLYVLFPKRPSTPRLYEVDRFDLWFITYL